MKRSFISGSLLIMTLSQSIAHAQMMDLPDPGGDGGSTQTLPAPSQGNTNTTPVQTQYAGSLRMNAISRKMGGTLYKIDLTEGSRLQRLDLRVAVSQVKIHSANLVTETGYKISVNQFSNTGVLGTSTVLTSENFSLNERIKTIEILAEAYSGEADVILTALADSGVPKLALRQEIPAVVVKPAPSVVQVDPKPNSGGSGSVVYYGSRFKVGDLVLYTRSYTARVVGIGRNGTVEISSDGYVESVYEEDLSKAVRCYKNQICQNDKVLYYGEIYSVLEIFDNGVARVDLRGYSVFDDVSELTKVTDPAKLAVRTMSCTADRKLCVGDRAKHAKGYVVTVAAIYSNGTTKVVDAVGAEVVRTSSLRLISKFGW